MNKNTSSRLDPRAQHGRGGNESPPVWKGRQQQRSVSSIKESTHGSGAAKDNTCPPHMKAHPENPKLAFGVDMDSGACANPMPVKTRHPRQTLTTTNPARTIKAEGDASGRHAHGHGNGHNMWTRAPGPRNVSKTTEQLHEAPKPKEARRRARFFAPQRGREINEFKDMRSNMGADVGRTQGQKRLRACNGLHREPKARPCHICAVRGRDARQRRCGP